MIYLFSNTPTDIKDVLHVELGKINFLEFKVPSFDTFDALIFTSKNGVKALEKRTKQWKNIPACVIGEATKKTVEDFGGKVMFCASSSYGDDFAREITSFMKDKRALFVRAKEVASDVGGILLKEGLHVEQLIVYESYCEQKQELLKPEKNSTLIFTAPSMVRCFLKYFSFESSWQVICIGKKTASALPKNISYMMPKVKSIEACIKLAK